MDTIESSPSGYTITNLATRAGDPFAYAGRHIGSTRHHRVDEEFVAILEEDFGIPRYALVNAFMGMPASPKREAIALCEWASRTDNPDRVLLAWARKNGRGTFAPAFFEDDAGAGDDA